MQLDRFKGYIDGLFKSNYLICINCKVEGNSIIPDEEGLVRALDNTASIKPGDSIYVVNKNDFTKKVDLFVANKPVRYYMYLTTEK